MTHSTVLARRNKKFSKDTIVLLLMTVPALICLIVFAYGPIYGWIYAFYDYRIGMPLKDVNFVGFKYFIIALKDPDLYRVIRNTLAMSFLSLLIIPFGALFAIFLNELRFKRYSKFLQTAATLPNFMSWIIVFSIAFIFLSPGDGVINNILMKSHLISKPLNPLGNANITWIFQTAIRMWKELGYNSIIFFAAIAGIDAEQFDAAKVDGAGRARIIWNITIPGLFPTLITLLLINIGFLLSNGFDQFYVFFNPLVASKIEVLDYYVYKIGLANNDIPFSTAISVSKTLISVVLIFFVNFVSKRLRGHSVI
jgi:putative aldouronate transport system permease protein